MPRLAIGGFQAERYAPSHMLAKRDHETLPIGGLQGVVRVPISKNSRENIVNLSYCSDSR